MFRVAQGHTGGKARERPAVVYTWQVRVCPTCEREYLDSYAQCPFCERRQQNPSDLLVLPARKSRSVPTSTIVAAAGAIISAVGLIAYLVAPLVVATKTVSSATEGVQQQICYVNQLEVCGYARELGTRDEPVETVDELVPAYFDALIPCPSGGTYAYEWNAGDPTYECSAHGQLGARH